jgi:hypothetical protein
LTYLIKYAII